MRIDVHELLVDVGGENAVGLLEVPRSCANGLVVLAHGLSADRESAYLRRIASHLHSLSMATVSMDAPLHGSRRQDSHPMTFDQWVVEWRAFWRSGGSDRMATEYRAILDACPKELATLPVGYWGTSLGTQTGIPWLADDPRPRAAVLGQFRGDGLLMERLAPRVAIPVFFIQQLDDQLHSTEDSQRLFDLLGSRQKMIRASPGSHTAVPQSVLDESVTWLCERLNQAAK